MKTKVISLIWIISWILWIISFIMIFFKDSVSIIIALSFFCISIFIILLYIIFILYKISYCKKTNWKDWYDSKASFIRFEQLNENKIIYEVYKIIQVTLPILHEIDWWFWWSWSKMPQISSKLQKVSNIINKEDKTKYDKAILKFKKSLFYNESTVLHFYAECDDTDKKSKPYVAIKIVNNTDIINYQVILKNKPNEFSENAKFSRKNFSADIAIDEKIDEVYFDKETKSYNYSLINPEVWYIYKLEWKK